MRKALPFLALLSALTCRPAFAGGCAMCQTAVTDLSDPFTKGLNAGIFFLLALPFLLTGTVGGIVWWSRRPPKGVRA